MRLYIITRLKIGDEMGELMHQGDEKSIAVKISVDGEKMPAPSAGREITEFGGTRRRNNEVVRVLPKHFASASHCRLRQKSLKSRFEISGFFHKALEHSERCRPISDKFCTWACARHKQKALIKQETRE